MSQSFVQLYVHVVFHTKNNKKLILKEIEEELYSYIGGILRNLKSVTLQIGGTNDHLHILCSLPKTMSLADMVEEVKKSSSKWIKSKGVAFENFYWQDGYGGFSVSNYKVDVVTAYIKNQKQHHTKVEFLDEYKKLLDEYRIAYEEKYL
jgi:putative transposase